MYMYHGSLPPSLSHLPLQGCRFLSSPYTPQAIIKGDFVKDPVEVLNFPLLDGGHRVIKVKKFPLPEGDHFEQHETTENLKVQKLNKRTQLT